MNFSQSQLKLRFFQLLSLLVVSALVWFAFCKRSVSNVSFADFSFVWSDSIVVAKNYFVLILVFVMMFVNWSAESIKWKLVTSSISHLSFFNAFKSVFAGLSFGFFFPNRTGEFIGKSLMLPKNDFWKAGILSLYTSFAQMIATAFFGILAVLFCKNILSEIINFDIHYICIYILIFVVLILIVVYFKFDLFAKLTKKFNKIYTHASVLNLLSFKTKFIVLILSFLRYAIFSTQYIILLMLFGISLPFYDLFFLVSLLYLSMMFVPTVLITDLPARSALSVLLFELWFKNLALQIPVLLEVKLIVVSTIIWSVNIVIPTLCGSVFIPQFSIFKRNK